MLNPPEIRRRLRQGAAAAFRGGEGVVAETVAWLASVSAQELLRIDDSARAFRYDRPVLGAAEEWTDEVLARAAALAAMHPDGYVRERAVRSLATSSAAVSDRALAVRVGDHVGVVREQAARAVLRRTALEQADRVVPVLQRFELRGRGAEARERYLRALVAEHGEEVVWARLRGSADRGVRRAAFRHSIGAGLLGLPDAVAMFRRERDQVIRRQFVDVIAGSATPEVITGLLLSGRSAEGRVVGLVRLTAAELDPADVERLLVDSSVLVRMWARRRWQEMGHDPGHVYAAVARSAAAPVVRARAYAGLAETGGAVDRAEIVGLVHSPEPALRQVGLSLLRGRATAEDVAALLRSVAGENSREARSASAVLIDSPQLWSLPDLAPLKAAQDPEHRRRAWWLHRNLGGWEAVIADLELLRDPDPRLAALGGRCTPPRFGRPTETERERIAELLGTVPVGPDQRRHIAFAAGLPTRPPEEPARRTPWWSRIWG